MPSTRPGSREASSRHCRAGSLCLRQTPELSRHSRPWSSSDSLHGLHHLHGLPCSGCCRQRRSSAYQSRQHRGESTWGINCWLEAEKSELYSDLSPSNTGAEPSAQVGAVPSSQVLPLPPPRPRRRRPEETERRERSRATRRTHLNIVRERRAERLSVSPPSSALYTPEQTQH